ncbi:glutaminase A [Aeromicrobium duanguangcaii]|uniref:Glutaminase n=1 Tax=Aeromicrobium duanguangcaii TaxID=2968086 RepID=A0ABY5KHP5_9ACTN|nr:glutaminase A [Aeromicrobium duanguangcaii]MCD9152902.1 glutaminase A [Aeromicrobium duanguangcaii]UUI69992.1 glutaminase A [Aeromicrobium duanguangcaii]
MRSPVPEYLDELLRECVQGDDSEPAAMALTTVDDAHHGAGDVEHRFTIQSMSKPFAYALAIERLGWDAVHEKIDVEPSGEAFNEISLDSETGRPHNPMINAGAIATAGLIGSFDTFAEFASKLAGRELGIDEDVFASEMDDAHRNLALAHLLAAYEIIDEPVEAVEHYLRQCALSVDVRDLATMASVLANGGVHPDSGERLMAERTAIQVLSVMATCGMYDDAGDWLASVGIPAKSGVSGGIIGVLPGQVGVAVFSPELDDHGTSVVGVEMMRRLSDEMGMHLMNPGRPSKSALSDVQIDDDQTVYVLAGDLLFSSAESLFARLIADAPGTEAVILDISRVGEISDVGRRMVLEAKSRLEEDGFTVRVVDADDTNRLD